MNSQNKVYALLVEPDQKPKITHIEVSALSQSKTPSAVSMTASISR